jgi:hypothetical protein
LFDEPHATQPCIAPPPRFRRVAVMVQVLPTPALNKQGCELVEATFVKDDLRFPLQRDRPLRTHDRPKRSHSSVSDIPSDTLAV